MSPILEVLQRYNKRFRTSLRVCPLSDSGEDVAVSTLDRVLVCSGTEESCIDYLNKLLPEEQRVTTSKVGRLQEDLDVEVAINKNLATTIENLRHNYEESCSLVAKMHAAAIGCVSGPRRGVVEDIEDLRKDLDNKKNANSHLAAMLKELRQNSLEKAIRQLVSEFGECYFVVYPDGSGGIVPSEERLRTVFYHHNRLVSWGKKMENIVPAIQQAIESHKKDFKQQVSKALDDGAWGLAMQLIADRQQEKRGNEPIS